MFKDIVSNFVREAPPYNFGVGDKHKPFKPGVTTVLEMHKNENPFGVSPKAVTAMVDACSRANRYPDITALSLRRKLAALHGVTPENILVVQGATSALGFIADMLIRPGDEVIVATPTYPNYYNVTKKNDGRIVEIPMDDSYEPDFDRMYAAINDKTRVVFICNPNNPTGTVCDDKKLIEFVHKVPANVAVVVDEAYFEFIDKPGYQSMIPQIADNLNLIVVKTFSKIYGMAGSRLGYVISNKEIIGYLNIDAVGFCCNRVALEGAEAAIDDHDFIEYTITHNKEGREYLTAEMEKMGFRVWPSHSNFIFFDPHMPPAVMAGELYTYGVNIRGDFVKCRISIGTMEQNRTAVEAMKQIVLDYKAGKLS